MVAGRNHHERYSGQPLASERRGMIGSDPTTPKDL